MEPTSLRRIHQRYCHHQVFKSSRSKLCFTIVNIRQGSRKNKIKTCSDCDSSGHFNSGCFLLLQKSEFVVSLKCLRVTSINWQSIAKTLRFSFEIQIGWKSCSRKKEPCVEFLQMNDSHHFVNSFFLLFRKWQARVIKASSLLRVANLGVSVQ